jgi:hypothetical protein
MDEQGFIFTTDATLALVVMIVLTASVVTYGLLPVFQGENHQHLEAIADSALETMDQSGALREAAVEYSNNNSTQAIATLNASLQTVIPNNIGYSLTMEDNPPVSANNGILSSNDVVTKVKVISGPQEGWMARAYYKQDEVQFQTINSTSVTTLWNFHNYLTNFVPWNGGLDSYSYWGGTYPTGRNPPPQTSVPITFYMPGTPNSAKFLMGAAAGNGQTKLFNPDVVINGVNHNNILNTSFHNIYTSAGQGPISNYQQNLSAAILNQGNNNFYVQFKNASSTMNMPWFTIIANYTTSLSVPKGIANDTIPFTDIAGIGRPGPGNTGIMYDLDTNTISTVPGRTVSWGALQNDFTFSTATPFELTGIPNWGTGSAVATTENVYLPPGNRLFDAVTVVNAYGGEDGAIVQVQDPSGVISTAFASFNMTARSDGGYGNVPGTINILPYLKVGNNKVRIITWDDESSGDYDLAGLESCYTKITYSKFPIRWDTFAFNNYQNTSSTKGNTTETQIEPFNIQNEAQNAFLFVGVGTATRNITVTVKDVNTGTSSVLYPANLPVPSVIDIGALDAAATQSKHIITTIVGNGSSLKPGNYTLTVTVTPSLAYESGDGASSPPAYGNWGDPTIFSGTRISIIYPKFLQNIWATGYASTPTQAAINAESNLNSTLRDAGYTNIDYSLFRNTTLYTGDVPNAIPVRLDLWTQ